MTHHYIVQLVDDNNQILVDLEPTHTSCYDPPHETAYHFDYLNGRSSASGRPSFVRVYKDYRLLCKYDELLCWPKTVAGMMYSVGNLEIPRAVIDEAATMNSTPKVCGCGLRAAGCGGIHQDYCDLAGMSEPMGY